MPDVLKLIKDKKWPPTKIPDIYIAGFDHWNCPENIARIDKTLRKFIYKSDRKKCLDVGFGNPILLQREIDLFSEINGLYISMDKALNAGCPNARIIEGNCYQIPFGKE